MERPTKRGEVSPSLAIPPEGVVISPIYERFS